MKQWHLRQTRSTYDHLIDSLSSDEKQFFIEKIFTDTKKIDDWIGFTEKLDLLDSIGDTKRRSAGRILSFFMYVLIFSGASILTFFLFLMGGEYLGTGFFLISILLFGVFLFSYIVYEKRNRFLKTDISNELRDFFYPMLNICKKMAGGQATMEATLNFNFYKHHQETKGNNISSKPFPMILASVSLPNDSAFQYFLELQGVDLTMSKHYNIKVNYITHLKLSFNKRFYCLSGNKGPFDLEETDMHIVITGKHEESALSNIKLSFDYDTSPDPGPVKDMINAMYRMVELKSGKSATTIR